MKHINVLLIGMALGLYLAGRGAAAEGAANAEALGWHLGIQAWTFNNLTFFDAVDKTASLGLHYIEAFPGQALSKDIPGAKLDHTMSPEQQKAALDKLKSANVKLLAYGVVELPADEAKARKVFDFAKAMGIETIVSEPLASAFPMLNKLVEEYGINIAIHNHPKPYSVYWNVDKLVEATKGLSKRIGSCADTGHWMRSGLNSLECLKKLQGRVISLHFKDVDVMGPKAVDMPWGTGATNAKGMLEELYRQGFKGLFSIEYEKDMPDKMPDLKQCVANFDKMAAEIAASAKK